MTENLVSTSYTMPPELKEWIEKQASAQDMSASQFLRRMIREARERTEAEAAKKPGKKSTVTA